MAGLDDVDRRARRVVRGLPGRPGRVGHRDRLDLVPAATGRIVAPELCEAALGRLRRPVQVWINEPVDRTQVPWRHP